MGEAQPLLEIADHDSFSSGREPQASISETRSFHGNDTAGKTTRFSDLPRDVLLTILHFLSDVESLTAFVSASKSVRHLYFAYHRQIVDSVLIRNLEDPNMRDYFPLQFNRNRFVGRPRFSVYADRGDEDAVAYLKYSRELLRLETTITGLVSKVHPTWGAEVDDNQFLWLPDAVKTKHKAVHLPRFLRRQFVLMAQRHFYKPTLRRRSHGEVFSRALLVDIKGRNGTILPCLPLEPLSTTDVHHLGTASRYLNNGNPTEDQSIVRYYKERFRDFALSVIRRLFLSRILDYQRMNDYKNAYPRTRGRVVTNRLALITCNPYLLLEALQYPARTEEIPYDQESFNTTKSKLWEFWSRMIHEDREEVMKTANFDYREMPSYVNIVY